MAQIEVDLSPEEVQEILIQHVKDTLNLRTRGYTYVFQWTAANGVHVSIDTRPKGEKHVPSESPFSHLILGEDSAHD